MNDSWMDEWFTRHDLMLCPMSAEFDSSYMDDPVPSCQRCNKFIPPDEVFGSYCPDCRKFAGEDFDEMPWMPGRRDADDYREKLLMPILPSREQELEHTFVSLRRGTASLQCSLNSIVHLRRLTTQLLDESQTTQREFHEKS